MPLLMITHLNVFCSTLVSKVISIPKEEWTHTAVVVSGTTKQWDIYINGVNRYSGSLTGTVGSELAPVQSEVAVTSNNDQCKYAYCISGIFRVGLVFAQFATSLKSPKIDTAKNKPYYTSSLRVLEIAKIWLSEKLTHLLVYWGKIPIVQHPCAYRTMLATSWTFTSLLPIRGEKLVSQ